MVTSPLSMSSHHGEQEQLPNSTDERKVTFVNSGLSPPVSPTTLPHVIKSGTETESDRDEDHIPIGSTSGGNDNAAAVVAPMLLSIDIPDDDSEASLMVLMRYMGCSPHVYGAIPQHGPMSNKNGREYVFGSFGESDGESLLSEVSCVYTMSEAMSEDEDKGDDIEPSWTMKNNEVGVEISIQDATLACRGVGGSLPSSPDRVRRVMTKNVADLKGKPSLIVDTVTKDTTTMTTTSKAEMVTAATSPGSVASSVWSSLLTSPTAVKLAADKAFLVKYAEDMKALKSAREAGKFRAQKSNLTVDTDGGILNEEEAKETGACPSSTAESRATTPVSLLPITPAGQAALRKYGGLGLSDLIADTTRETGTKTNKKTKEEEGTVDAIPESLSSNTTELLQAADRLLISDPAQRNLVEGQSVTVADFAPKVAGQPTLTVDTTGEAKTTTKKKKKKKTEKKGLVVRSPGSAPSPAESGPIDDVEITSNVGTTSTPMSPTPESLLTPVTTTCVSSTISSTHQVSSPQNHCKIEQTPSESLSTRSDKENSSQEETSPLTNNIVKVVEPKSFSNLAVSASALSPSMGEQKADLKAADLRSQADELRTKAHEWLARAALRSPGVNSSLMPSSPSERKVMGSISSNSPLHSPKEQVSSPLAFARKITSEAKQGTSLKSPPSSPSNASNLTPKKSILEQLAEIRAKQRELDEQHMAKREMRN
ncbi:hypothetical protein ACHAXA_005676 [Cyclostephanos tholiformis]|uniref:Uncharacterized protein n=1 Tax=Cyclostephanos tholiformis TaxID=382380 RepID=A0ABD3SQF2_9STRA